MNSGSKVALFGTGWVLSHRITGVLPLPLSKGQDRLLSKGQDRL